MLKDRILFTLKFFDLLQTPLTASELRIFLFNDPEIIRGLLDKNYELAADAPIPQPAAEQEILHAIRTELKGEVAEQQSHFCLKGSEDFITQRIGNAVYHDKREKIIRRFLPPLKFLPFVRAVAVGGSHTLSQNKKDSDIDLLVILEPQYLWLGRLLVTGYFQLTGYRRHGRKIANRFCLNHYLAGPIPVESERDPYNAMEYLRLRPEIYPSVLSEFIENNFGWMRCFFPNAELGAYPKDRQNQLQKLLETVFMNKAGRWLNEKLGQWQMRRILRGQPAVATKRELSFHSKKRKFAFLSALFEDKRYQQAKLDKMLYNIWE